MRWSISASLIAAGSVLLAAGVGCESLLGVDFDSARLKPEREAAVCDSVRPPDPPALTNGGAGEDITVLLTSANFGDEPAPDGQPGFDEVGYDLDQNCANRGEAPLCKPPAWTSGNPTDGPGGQDNAVGHILVAQQDAFGQTVITSQLVNDGMASGIDAPVALLRIRGYGGFSDDDQVDVDWFVGLPAQRNPPLAFVPKLDGTDEWPLVANFLQGFGDAASPDPDSGLVIDAGTPDSRVSLFHDANAYVNHYTLVAHFPDARPALSNVYFHVVDVVLTATLARSSASEPWRVENGVIAGMIDAGSMLGLIPRITLEVVGIPLCTDNANYGAVKTFICRELDLRRGTSAGACNAASFGIAFETVPVRLGSTTLLDFGNLCTPATDPENDDCTNAP